MSFRTEALEAWEIMLDVMKDADATGCVFRYPVTPAGADKAGADDFDCLPSPTPDKLTLVEGGFFSDYQFSLSARVDDFDTMPIAGDLFLRKGRVSRILTVENSEFSPTMILHCGSPKV